MNNLQLNDDAFHTLKILVDAGVKVMGAQIVVQSALVIKAIEKCDVEKNRTNQPSPDSLV